MSTSFENTICAKALPLDMRQKHNKMLVPFKIKLKKDCNKNTSAVHLISEVVKPKIAR